MAPLKITPVNYWEQVRCANTADQPQTGILNFMSQSAEQKWNRLYNKT